MPYYINCRTNYGVETVDEFETQKEAIAMLREYSFAAPEMGYYLSSRSTRAWRGETSRKENSPCDTSQ